MIIATGLSILARGMGGVLQGNRIINIMWIYGLMIKINIMNETMSLGADLGLWNGIIKISNNELIIGIIMIILSGIITQYYKEGLIIVLILTGMWMVTISKEWISIILSIELQSSGIYMLVCKRSISSGLRYNIIGGVSSSIMMLSWLMIYSESGLSNIEEIKIWEEGLGTFGEKNGIILGILIKMGTGPMHNWISDVMENIGSEENKWVGGMSKIPLIKIINEWNTNMVMNIIPIILTLGIGGILGSTAYRIKKFLAYSGIHNLGYVLIISKSEKWIFFITQYVITLISILTVYKENRTIWSIKGNGSQWLGITIIISMLSSIGIPPLIGFRGKLSIIEWVVENGWWITTGIIIIGSVISGRNYIRIVKNATEGLGDSNATQLNSEGKKVATRGLKISILGSLMVTNIVERYTQCI